MPLLLQDPQIGRPHFRDQKRLPFFDGKRIVQPFPDNPGPSHPVRTQPVQMGQLKFHRLPAIEHDHQNSGEPVFYLSVGVHGIVPPVQQYLPPWGTASYEAL